MKMIYFAYIPYIVNFGISLYGATSKEIWKSNKNNFKFKTSKKHFSELIIFIIYGLYIYEVVMNSRKKTGEQTFNGDSHDYDRRGRNEVTIPPHHLARFCKEHNYMGIKFYNELPQFIQAECNDKKSKNLLKEYLIKAPYPLDEL
jgi:hypothetical protein